MILLNGIPAIFGASLFHAVFINIFVIMFEYRYLSLRLNMNRVLLRTIIANIISVLVGLIAFYASSSLVPGNVEHLGGDFPDSADKWALIPAMIALIATNILLELPAFLVAQKLGWRKIVKPVVVANLITNIPIAMLYGMFAL